jgi:quinoprotein glucose dehydrogenase
MYRLSVCRHFLFVMTGSFQFQVGQIPLGNHPEVQKKGEPETGSVGSPGPIVTAGGLVFITGTRDKKIRAFNKSNGKLIWQYTMPAAGTATACTYASEGKQFVAVSMAGDKINPGGYIIAYALPD